jgi:hypothetical protein
VGNSCRTRLICRLRSRRRVGLDCVDAACCLYKKAHPQRPLLRALLFNLQPLGISLAALHGGLRSVSARLLIVLIALIVIDHKADTAFGGVGRRHQLLECGDDTGDSLVVVGQLLLDAQLQRPQLPRQVFV